MISMAIFLIQPASLWNIVLLLSVSTVFGIVVLFLKYSLWRDSCSKLMPGRKFRFLNPLGNLIEHPLSKNGYSINVGTSQFLSANTELYRKHKLFCIWTTYIPIAVLVQAEAVQILMNDTTLTEKGWMYEWFKYLLGTGLITSSGKKWKSRRRLLTPCLYFDILESFMTVFNEKSQLLAKRLQNETQKDFTDIAMPIGRCSLDITCETLMGVKTEDNGRDAEQYIESLKRLEELVMARVINIWQWWTLTFSFTPTCRKGLQDVVINRNFTRSLIQEKKRAFLFQRPEVSNRKRRVAFLDLLMEHHLEHKDFTEEDISEEVVTFTAAGHNSSKISMCYALYLIGLYKEIQDKLHEELDSLFGDDIERFVTVDDLRDMKYLDCVLKESKRLYPPVPIVARTINEDIDICGYTMPKSTTCIVSIYDLHRDPEQFPNPEKFDPDRFLPENSLQRHPFAYIPFAAGPRNCIAQRFATLEEKVVVSTILRHFTVESLDPRDKIVPATEITLNSSIPFRLRIRPRI